MRSVDAWFVFSVAVLASAAACGSDDSNPGGAGAKGGSAGSAGSNGRGGTSSDGGGSGGTAGSSGVGGCERFGFVASGASCPASGCGSFSCSCPDAFPKSITSCTADGCLTSGACSAICAADLGDALACTDTHTIAIGGSGGSAGTAGTTGSGGAGGYVPPPCTPSDVQRPPVAAQRLGANSVEASALLVDETGASYVAGTIGYSDAVDFGGGALSTGGGLFLLKLDGLRRHVWSKRFGGTFGIAQVKSMKFAANGEILIAGVTGLDADLGGGPKPHATGPQFYVARYKRDGAFVAGHVFLTSNSIPTLSSLVETPSGDYLLFGSFSGTAPFGASSLTSAGEQDAFIVRLSSSGSVLDVRQYGRQRNDLIFDAISASDGTLYLLGFAYYAVNFGQNPIDLGSDGLSYVVALDPSLNPVWQKIVGSGGAYPRRALLDGATLVVAGDAYGNVFYGDAQSGALPKANTFVFRINRATGALERGDTYETTGNGAQISALAGFSDGLAIAGYVGPPADFGGGALMSSQIALLPFVARFDASGRHLWSTLFCTRQTRGVSALAAAGTTPIVALPFQYDLMLGPVSFPDRGTALLEMAP